MLILLLFCLILHVNGLEDANIIQDGGVVLLSLKNYTQNNECDYQTVRLYNNASITILVKDLPNDLDFVVLQVHTLNYPVILKDSSDVTNTSNKATGTNIGLIKFNNFSSLNFYLNNVHNFKITALIAAVGYTNGSPVPGGCAAESPNKEKPYLDLQLSETMITVKADPSSLPTINSDCDPRSGLKYTFYHMFLPEWDFSEETYFSSILSMITYNSIVSRSMVALESPSGHPFQRIFSSYPGIGRIFTAVVKSSVGDISVYVPTFTYSCNTTINTDNCVLPMTVYTKIENAFLFFLGIFICLKGHKYFHFNLLVMGTITGTFATYIFLSKNNIQDLDFMMVSTAAGVIFGIIWVLAWWSIHSPILSVCIPLFNCGCLFSAIFFTTIRDKLPLFESDVNYWAAFFTFALIILAVSITHTLAANIAAACIIGAYMTAATSGISVGSGLIYIIINVIRRATIEGFNQANTEIPFQVPDVILWLAVCILVVQGWWKQRAQARGKPPFPPLPSILRHESQRDDDGNERTSLLADSNFPTYT